MSKQKPTAIEIATVLDSFDTLVQDLKREPWSEYDPNLQKALLMLMKTSLQGLQRAARSISKVSPEETRSESPTLGEPWFNHALDQMQ
jgi:hypothetical protein